MWSQTYGGRYEDSARVIIQTSDGGYALVGSTPTSGVGNNDYWLIKIDDNGDEEWNQTYGGLLDDYPSALIQTSDGGYAIAGSWLWIKTDEYGNLKWNQTFLFGNTRTLVETSDGGYAISGEHWLCKTDSQGNSVWNQTYDSGAVQSLVETSDGGFAIAGVTSSLIDESYDFWLAKTNE